MLDVISEHLPKYVVQLVFWGSIFTLPVGLLLGWKGLWQLHLGRALCYFLASTLCLTHFLWYFFLLGGALASTSHASFTASPWLSFLPYGAAAGVVFAGVRALMTAARKSQPAH